MTKYVAHLEVSKVTYEFTSTLCMSIHILVLVWYGIQVVMIKTCMAMWLPLNLLFHRNHYCSCCYRKHCLSSIHITNRPYIFGWGFVYACLFMWLWIFNGISATGEVDSYACDSIIVWNIWLKIHAWEIATSKTPMLVVTVFSVHSI